VNSKGYFYNSYFSGMSFLLALMARFLFFVGMVFLAASCPSFWLWGRLVFWVGLFFGCV
jgi:hypothetical protein